MKENWRQAAGFSDYEVSDKGRLRRKTSARGTQKGKILKGYIKPSGHRCYVLMQNGLKKHVRSARLVAKTFISEPPFDAAEVCHNDGNASNDIVSNLRWDTSAGNKADMLVHGTRLKGEKHPSAKLSRRQILQIKKQREKGVLQKVLAKRYNVKQAHISRIENGVRWG